MEETESCIQSEVEGYHIKACKMVDQFVGTWKMVSSENFDDYMKAIGKILVCVGLS